MRHRQIAVRFVTALTLVMAAAAPPAYGQTFSVLYNFGTSAADPCQPFNSGVIAQGQDGNLYSTATSCGGNDGGSVFRLTPSRTFSVVFDFNIPAGSIFSPFSGLTLDPANGNFYGTTHGGGTVDDGTLFRITPTGILTVLHSFTGGSDGYTSDAPPIIGTDGNLYGTSRRGGNFTACGGTGCGTVYKMTPSGTLIWSYEFDITHGLYPYAPLVQGTDGNFYGTTSEGGTGAGSGSGVVFKITSAGKLTVLHNFCSKPACADGQYPYSPVVEGSDGNFYGTTASGGANGYGEVFKITPSGTLTVLHSMNPATDGVNPYAGLVLASDGNFYGVNESGSPAGNTGTIFKITPQGVYTVLHNFDGTTGANPYVTLVQHTNGILYGDTELGGSGNQVNCHTGMCGVLYSLNANLHPFVKLLSGSGKVGSQIGILGQGFSASSVVKFNGVKATTVKLTGTTFLLATVPVGTLDGYVTVTTGTTTLKSSQRFLVHDSWGSGAAMPTPVRYPAGVGAINGKIYVVGGITTGSTIIATSQVYNPATNKWTTAAPLPTAVTDGTGAVVNGILYVIGGYNGTHPLNTVYAYNPSTNTWTSKASMPTARASIGSAVEKSLIYVIGGVTGATRLNKVESYNPATDTWTEEAPLPVGKSEPSVGLVGTTIVAADGYTSSGDTGDNEGYNATTNTWKSLASDPTPRHDSCYGAIGGLMYIAGGGLSPIALNESYSVSSNSWTTLSPIPVATTAPGSATWNGQLFCFGGGDSTGVTGGNFYNNLQIYQP